MKIKKCISIFLSVLVFCSVIFSTSAFAAIMSSQGFNFQRIDASSKAEILGITKGSSIATSKSITIPSSLNGCVIVSIGKNAFNNNTVQEEIIMPKTITSISDYAFSNATALKTITIPEKVQTIGSLAFYGCKSLQNVNFQGSKVNYIERATFYGCTSLENFIVPSSVNTIDSMAFAYCNSLKKIYLPPTVSVISNDAFLNTKNITIYGTIGTNAYYYAMEKGIPFVDLPTDKDTLFLNNSITAAKYKLVENMSVYIPSTVQKLQEEYEKALIVQSDFFSTQEDIDTAATNLSMAYKSLKLTAMIQLETVVANANTVLNDSGIYTEASVNELSKAITSAEELIKTNNQSETIINDMITLVNNKIAALVLQSKADLQALIAQYDEIVKTEYYKYTEDSITAFTTAINTANTVIENTTSTDEIYKAEINNLTQAYNSLATLKTGDVNLDNNVGVIDVIFVLRNIVGTVDFNERNQYTADMSKDGKITIFDAIMLQQYILEIV